MPLTSTASLFKHDHLQDSKTTAARHTTAAAPTATSTEVAPLDTADVVAPAPAQHAATKDATRTMLLKTWEHNKQYTLWATSYHEIGVGNQPRLQQW